MKPLFSIYQSFFVLIMFVVSSCNGQVKSTAFKATIDNLLEETVDTIGIVRLKQEMAAGTKYVLLDAREKKEYAVSHIKGANYIGYDHFEKSALNKIDSNAQIVVYCSIGYRSEKIGEKLDSMGYRNVQNLYGGIFEWINQDGEVEADAEITQKIHGFDKWWSRFLQKGEIVLD